MHKHMDKLAVAILPMICLVALASAPMDAWSAPSGKTSLGTLSIKTHDARGDVFVESVEAWREGCDLLYKFTFGRKRAHGLKVRLLLSLDAGPDSVATRWATSAKTGSQVAEGRLTTEGCWIRKAKTLSRASLEVEGDAPEPADKAGHEFLGRVVFNRWGSTGDVFYRHIRTWRAGCQIHYQFLYKRRSSHRRRIRMTLTFDNGTVKTQWVRSKAAGWREIVGDVISPDCFAKGTRTLRNAAFESERY